MATPAFSAIIVGVGLLVLALLTGLAVRFFYAQYAPESPRIVASDLPPTIIWDRVNSRFPEQPESPERFWTRVRDQEEPATLALSSYPLSSPGIRLLLVLTLVVPGAIALIVMGRQERVTIRVEERDGGSHVSARARGYVACTKAEEFLRQVSR